MNAFTTPPRTNIKKDNKCQSPFKVKPFGISTQSLNATLSVKKSPSDTNTFIEWIRSEPITIDKINVLEQSNRQNDFVRDVDWDSFRYAISNRNIKMIQEIREKILNQLDSSTCELSSIQKHLDF